MRYDTARSAERKVLLNEITAVSFVLDELRLYLDTHTDCAQALEMYAEYQKRRHTMTAEYTKNFGSLYSYFVNTDNGWDWAESPMPWEEGI